MYRFVLVYIIFFKIAFQMSPHDNGTTLRRTPHLFKNQTEIKKTFKSQTKIKRLLKVKRRLLNMG